MSDAFCASSPEAAVMSDAEFWEHVYPQPEPPDTDDNGPDETFDPSCPECGSFTACGYDAEGRPMIHTTSPE